MWNNESIWRRRWAILIEFIVERMITPSLELSKSQSSGNSFSTVMIRILLIMIIILIIGVFVLIAVIKSTQYGFDEWLICRTDDDLFDLYKYYEFYRCRDAVESASLLSKQYEQSSFLPRGPLSPDRFASFTSAVSEFSGIESLMSRKGSRTHRKKEGKTRNKPRPGSPRIAGTTCPSCLDLFIYVMIRWICKCNLFCSLQELQHGVSLDFFSWWLFLEDTKNQTFFVHSETC